MKTITLPRPLNALGRLLPALLIALLAVFGTASLAAAHDDLIGSSPEAGSTLTESPKEIVLNFSGQLQTLANDGGTVVVITKPDGEQVENSFEVQGRDVVITPAAELANGQYTVASRVISSDGHPIEKSFMFTVDAAQAAATDPAPASSAAAPSAEPTAVDSEPVADPAEDAPGGISPVVWIILAVLGAGAAVLVLVNFARRNNIR